MYACMPLVAFLPAARADEIPADPALRWWKGNLHTHTFWSDGNDFPEMAAEWYRDHGYHFLALSDHNVTSEGQRWMNVDEVARRGGPEALAKYVDRFGSQWVDLRTSEADGTREVRLKPQSEYRPLVEERGRFLMIPSEEISDRAEGVPIHLNAANLAEVIQPLGGMTIRETIAANVRAVEEQARRTGREMLVHLNHPNYGWAVTAEELAEVLSERFFEVYNGHPGVGHLGDADHPPVEFLWDVANTLRIARLDAAPLSGLATDDTHDYHNKKGTPRPGRGWVMVRSRHLTPERLIQAMKRGDFYSSSGVALSDVAFDPASGVLRIEIEPEEGATFTTQFIGTLSGADLSSQARTDSKGAPVKTTARYGPEIGAVLSTVSGLRPEYKLAGTELYVRAVITSDRPAADPSFDGQKKQAWTQPVGWEKWLQRSSESREK